MARRGLRVFPYLLLICCSLVPEASTAAEWFSLPDTALMSGEFGVVRYGPGSFVRTDVPGPGVRFDFSNLGSSGTGVSDNYPVGEVYGQNLPSHGNGDFSNYSKYAVGFRNMSGGGTVHVSLFLNTGFTGPSGNPPSDPANDTFWQSDWIAIPAGSSVTVVLDFNHAIAYNITDNPVPHSEGGQSAPDGDYYLINGTDRCEVTNIGFQVADFSGSSPSTELLVRRLFELPVSEHLWMVALLGVLLLIGLRSLSRRAETS
ncbi:MAG: hypothetical protein AMJ46_10525 [Latescibacteria bacterium DG_63]|nr:MAG: hypothetical protein AMJ46_10525 [Latescibacteria bacterium DG_63]